MRLKTVERGRSVRQKLMLAMVRLMFGTRVPDVLRVLVVYRPEFFGKPFNALTQAVMRGPSEWSIGERELFAAFTSRMNECRYCASHHRSTSVRALGNE